MVRFVRGKHSSLLGSFVRDVEIKCCDSGPWYFPEPTPEPEPEEDPLDVEERELKSKLMLSLTLTMVDEVPTLENVFVFVGDVQYK
jgi:hypothetical protein